MRDLLRTCAAILTFTAVMALLTATARGAADPPPLVAPDPPRLEKRVSDLEKRVAELEASLAAKPKCQLCGTTCKCAPGGITLPGYELRADGYYWPVSAPAVKTVPTVATARQPSGHTHTCANGHTWDHSVTAGHNCPVCGLSQYVQDARPRAVTAGAVSAPRTYSLPSGGCANGNCSTGFQSESLFQPAGRRFTFPVK